MSNADKKLLSKAQIEMMRTGLLASDWCGFSKVGTVNELCDLALKGLAASHVAAPNENDFLEAAHKWQERAEKAERELAEANAGKVSLTNMLAEEMAAGVARSSIEPEADGPHKTISAPGLSSDTELLKMALGNTASCLGDALAIFNRVAGYAAFKNSADSHEAQGWSIRSVDGRWRTMDTIGMPDWTDDANEALSFRLRKHADTFAQDDPDDVRIVPSEGVGRPG